MAINPNYVLTEANQNIVTLVNGGTGSQGRKYTKVNSGWCFCAIYNDLDSIDWYGIVVVSNVSANAVAYKATDRYGTYYSATPATVNYNGETWYITYPDAYVQKDSGSVKNWSYADVKGYYPDWYVSQYNETELIGFLDEIFDKCTYKPSGGAGSGYIGNSLVSNKKMVGYNVPTSSAESTKTESVNEASESPVSGKPKIGNGYAKIRFLRPLQEKSIVAEMLASNQFKINGTGEAPTIYSGSMGSYDSSTNSYYFSSNCGMDWKNWSNIGMTLEKAQKLTKIEFEYEGLVSNNALGRSFDMQMQTYFNTNLLFINGIADGYDDSSSDKQKFARIKNSGSDQWETTEEVPFNSSSYQNAFHKVKWVWEIENSVAKELTIYVDGNLFCHYSGTLYSFSITALGTNILRFAAIDHTNVRSVKIAFYYMG